MMPIEIALGTLWALLIFRNKAALVPLLIFIADMTFLWAQVESMHRICLSASICFIAATIKLTPDYLRAPLLTTGAICWVGALDEFLYTNLAVSTVYYDVMPYLIITINAYIAAVLMNKGGLQHVGLTKRPSFLVNRWRIRL